jgi:hypothetical protein
MMDNRFNDPKAGMGLAIAMSHFTGVLNESNLFSDDYSRLIAQHQSGFPVDDYRCKLRTDRKKHAM